MQLVCHPLLLGRRNTWSKLTLGFVTIIPKEEIVGEKNRMRKNAFVWVSSSTSLDKPTNRDKKLESSLGSATLGPSMPPSHPHGTTVSGLATCNSKGHVVWKMAFVAQCLNQNSDTFDTLGI
jgi:hypothetical protein